MSRTTRLTSSVTATSWSESPEQPAAAASKCRADAAVKAGVTAALRETFAPTGSQDPEPFEELLDLLEWAVMRRKSPNAASACNLGAAPEKGNPSHCAKTSSAAAAVVVSGISSRGYLRRSGTGTNAH